MFSTHENASIFAALFPVGMLVRPAKARERKYGINGDGFVEAVDNG